ncbi:MAG: hypothetical protein K2N35_14485 [Muribaculaceae bacterium]|nr:hypothetical protein [Muribaculaceae bacterium]
MKKIALTVPSTYLFLDICIWKLDDIKRISHYATNRDVIYVEVNRDAVEGVFSLLSEAFHERRVFFTPWQDYEAVRPFDTIYTQYDVSSSKLMRYARRRSKSDNIKELISEINS